MQADIFIRTPMHLAPVKDGKCHDSNDSYAFREFCSIFVDNNYTAWKSVIALVHCAYFILLKSSKHIVFVLIDKRKENGGLPPTLLNYSGNRLDGLNYSTISMLNNMRIIFYSNI